MAVTPTHISGCKNIVDVVLPAVWGRDGKPTCGSFHSLPIGPDPDDFRLIAFDEMGNRPVVMLTARPAPALMANSRTVQIHLAHPVLLDWLRKLAESGPGHSGIWLGVEWQFEFFQPHEASTTTSDSCETTIEEHQQEEQDEDETEEGKENNAPEQPQQQQQQQTAEQQRSERPDREA